MVSNLPRKIDGEKLAQFYEEKSFKVISAAIVCDTTGKRSRGFGFVEFESEEERDRAIQQTDMLMLEQRSIAVKPAFQ